MKKKMMILAFLMLAVGMYAAGNGSTTNDIRTIEVDWVAGEVVVTEGFGDEISWTETFVEGKETEKTQLCYELDGDKLSIRFCCSRLPWETKGLCKKLLISIPANRIYNKVDLENVSGDIKATVSAYKTELQTVSGSIMLSVPSVTGEVELETVSGHIDLCLPEDAVYREEHKSVSGSFSNEVPSQKGDKAMEVEMKTISGNMRILPL